SPIQQAFIDAGAVQCGFCTPGLLVAADEMLERNPAPSDADIREDRKSTRLNSSHVKISYAVFCLKKKRKQYYLPLQYVVLYLYYLPALFDAARLTPPSTFDEFLAAATALTTDSVYGFSMRAGPRR